MRNMHRFMCFKIRFSIEVYLFSSLVDLHIRHQQTRRLLEKVCFKQKPWTLVVFRYCCREFVERIKTDSEEMNKPSYN